MDFTELRKGDRVRVRMAFRKRASLAVVVRDAWPVGRFTLVAFAWVKDDSRGPGNETIGRHNHVAQSGVDHIERA